MRYLTLAEALVVAEAVTGISSQTLARSARIGLLDSALHAPQAGFGDEDFYETTIDKAAVLAVRIARNHPLPDGNKRLAWQALTIFLALNGHHLEATPDDAVDLMLSVAAGDVGETDVAAWLEPRTGSGPSDT